MEPPSSYRIRIINETGERLPSKAIRTAVEAALTRFGPPAGEVNILVSTSEVIRALNRDFREIDEDTDVLTFPGDAENGNGLPDEPIGEIAISLPYAKQQAALRRVSSNHELAFLAIHGALHLCGFDDQSERERAEMVDTMNLVATQVGLKPDLHWASILHEAAR